MATAAYYLESKMSYNDLPSDVKKKYPPSKATYAGDAIAEREGMLPASKVGLNGWRCAAMSKSKHARCGLAAIAGSLLCRSHGGKYKKGIASSQYRDGSRSQVLPLRIQAQYQAILQDPDLLSLRQDLGVLEVRIQELLGQLDTQESGNAWEQIQDLGQQLGLALTTKQLGQIPELVAQLQALTQESVAGTATWSELRGLLRDRAQVATLEHKRLQEVNGSLSIEAFLAMVGHLLQRLHSILMGSLEPGVARQLLSQFQQEVLLLQQHGLQAPKLKHPAAQPVRQLEPGTRRTINPDGTVYVPLAQRAPDPLQER